MSDPMMQSPRGGPPARIGDAVERMLRPTTREATCVCGRVYDQWHFAGVWHPGRCDDCRIREDAERAARETADREADRRRRALETLDVPPMYEDATIENFEPIDPAHGRIVELARRYLDLWPLRQDKDRRYEFPHIAVFSGAPGSGKGHIAWAIAKAVAVEHGATVKYTVLSDCVRDLREAWDRIGESEAARLRVYRGVGLLVIDEVSLHAFHGRPAQHLYDLIAYRETWLRPTILTTNEDRHGLADIVGPALVSRIAAFADAWWHFGSTDYRVHRRKALRQSRGVAA